MTTPSRSAPASSCPQPAAVDEAMELIARVEGGDASLTPDEAAVLVGALTNHRKPVCRRAAEALAMAMRSGGLASEVCDRELDSDDAARRWGAAFALHRAGHSGPRVLDAALATLELADGDVRWAAASIVTSAARADAAIRERLHRLASAPGATARKMALLCLADSGERDPSIYRRALADDDPFVRIAALTSLGRLGERSNETIEAIRSVAASDGEASVRRAASAILSRLTSAQG